MEYTIILAAHVSGGVDPIGHAWVAVEYPKKTWLVRGFYPEEVTAGILTGQSGRICDDYERFKEPNLRTRTFRGLKEGQVAAAKGKMFEYGSTMHDPKPTKNRRGGTQRTNSTQQPSAYPYGLLTNQCAVFAYEVCKAAGIDPIPFVPQIPVVIWNWLGTDGANDALSLPAPFGKWNY